jgi:mycofactocin precursor
MKETDGKEILEKRNETDAEEQMTIATPIIEEITIEELAVDGICGIY